jgi:hypothetical protein
MPAVHGVKIQSETFDFLLWQWDEFMRVFLPKTKPLLLIWPSDDMGGSAASCSFFVAAATPGSGQAL